MNIKDFVLSLSFQGQPQEVCILNKQVDFDENEVFLIFTFNLGPVPFSLESDGSFRLDVIQSMWSVIDRLVGSGCNNIGPNVVKM